MTKKPAQNKIADFLSKIICKITIKWSKNRFLLLTFFFEHERANISFKADVNMFFSDNFGISVKIVA